MELKRILPLFPRKPHPIPDQNGQNLYPFSDRKGAKTLPFGAAQTHMIVQLRV